MTSISRGRRRWRKVQWKLGRVADWVDNHGVLLPTAHALIAPGIGKQIFFSEYEAKEVEIVERRLGAEDTVMEVGAGIGFLSALCAKRIGSDRVVTYEANPALLPLIAETHRRNGVSPRVENALLARGDGECSFFVEPEFWASSARAVTTAAREIRIPQRDLNAALATHRPTFLIVDIEGGELDFFAYARLDGVRKICVETHPGILSDAELSGLFAGLFAQGFALDFTLIRKNVFFLHRD